MPINKNKKTRVNVYLDNGDYNSILNWCKLNKVSISSLYNMLTQQFIKNENNGENTYVMLNTNTYKLEQNHKPEISYDDYINDSTRPGYNWLQTALYNLEHNYMND